MLYVPCRMSNRSVSLTPLFVEKGSKRWSPGSPLPASLLVLRLGDNPSTKGTFRVTELTAKMFDQVQKQKGHDRVTIDFEHNTLPGSEAYKQAREPRPVAGRGVARVTPLGIEVHEIEWTDTARKMAQHYGDLSPAPYHLEDGTVVGLHSVALVRDGAVYDLTFCSAGELDVGEASEQREDDMEKFLAALKAAKLIPETGAETELVAALTALSARIATIEEALKGVTLDAVKADVAALSTALDGMRADGVKAEKRHLLELAMRDGKVVALAPEVVEKMTVTELSAHIEKTGVTVPLEQRTRLTGLAQPAPAAKKPTELQLEVAKAIGVDAEKVKWN
jgi:hypothetical protein